MCGPSSSRRAIPHRKPPFAGTLAASGGPSRCERIGVTLCLDEWLPGLLSACLALLLLQYGQQLSQASKTLNLPVKVYSDAGVVDTLQKSVPTHTKLQVCIGFMSLWLVRAHRRVCLGESHFLKRNLLAGHAARDAG